MKHERNVLFIASDFESKIKIKSSYMNHSHKNHIFKKVLLIFRFISKTNTLNNETFRNESMHLNKVKY